MSLDVNILVTEIWLDRLECDPKKTGSLGREAFVQGMWNIDAELSKAAKAPRRQR